MPQIPNLCKGSGNLIELGKCVMIKRSSFLDRCSKEMDSLAMTPEMDSRETGFGILWAASRDCHNIGRMENRL